jgi:hypothetical protein
MTNVLVFEIVKLQNGLPSGLINYGMEITTKEKLIIYGGQIEKTSVACAVRQRDFVRQNSLWMLDMMKNIYPDFFLLKWDVEIGGFSKIILLQDEIVCVLNTGFPNQMRIINFDLMESYDIYVTGIPSGLLRTGYGIVKANGTDFIIYGGYDESGVTPKFISPFNVLFHLSFSSSSEVSNNEMSSLDSVTVTGIVVSIIVSLLLLMIFVFTYRKWIIEYEIHKKRRRIELEEINVALENSKKVFEARMKNITEDPEFTATLALPNSNELSIPGYLLKDFYKDFRPGQVLTKGGMGQVFLGTILNEELAND